MGMPAERMAALIEQVFPRQATLSTADAYVPLLHDAGFQHVSEVLRVMDGAINAWIAR